MRDGGRQYRERGHQKWCSKSFARFHFLSPCRGGRHVPAQGCPSEGLALLWQGRSGPSVPSLVRLSHRERQKYPCKAGDGFRRKPRAGLPCWSSFRLRALYAQAELRSRGWKCIRICERGRQKRGLGRSAWMSERPGARRNRPIVVLVTFLRRDGGHRRPCPHKFSSAAIRSAGFRRDQAARRGWREACRR
jgi:hypothetical protein